MYQCPECGAAYENDETCKSVFDSFLALEFTDPGYGAVHFLTVACYMIQHQRYSDAGLLWIHNQLTAYIEKGLSSEEIRQQARHDTGQEKRAWKILRSTEEPGLPSVQWSFTIADVAKFSHDANSYRENITRWAETTLREMLPQIEFARRLS